jgi:hypothetical protein
LKAKLLNSVTFKLCYHNTLGILVVVFMLFPVCTFAQFVVKENTSFSVNTTLTSLEEVNSFQSNVVGEEGVLYFKGEKQTLETADKVSLPNVVVDNASQMSILTPLKINGNLTLNGGVLKLSHQIVILGDLIKLNNATIENEFLLELKNHKYQKEEPYLSLNQNVIGAFLFNYIIDIPRFEQLLKKGISVVSNNFYEDYKKDSVYPPPDFG